MDLWGEGRALPGRPLPGWSAPGETPWMGEKMPGQSLPTWVLLTLTVILAVFFTVLVMFALV